MTRLFAEYADAMMSYQTKFHRAKTNEEARTFAEPDQDAYAARFLAMAREAPDDPGAARALACVINTGGGRDLLAEVVDLLKARHVRSPWIGDALYTLSMVGRDLSTIEPFLRAVLMENPDAPTRDQASFALADYLLWFEKAGRRFRENPEANKFAISIAGEDRIKQIRDRDPVALHDEAVALLERLDEHAPPSPDPDPKRRTLASRAAMILTEMRELVVGKTAPEIEGKDVDGRPMKLSDHRGKVVVLAWWATWCGPCMAAVPAEKALIRRMEGKPFVFLGINGDEDVGRLKAQVREHGIPWDSWYEGGPNGPISTRWNVLGWPTVYVLDRDGIIRFKGHREQDKIEAMVDRLIGGGR